MSRPKPPPRVGSPEFKRAIKALGSPPEIEIICVGSPANAACAGGASRKIGPDMSAQTDALDAEILSRLKVLGPGSHARKALDGADDPAKVRASLGRLVDAGKVLKIGRKKGTRYALPTPEETPAD